MPAREQDIGPREKASQARWILGTTLFTPIHATDYFCRSRRTSRILLLLGPKSVLSDLEVVYLPQRSFFPFRWVTQATLASVNMLVQHFLCPTMVLPSFFVLKVALTSRPQVTKAWSQEYQSINSFWGDFNTCPTPMTLQRFHRRKVTHLGRPCPRECANQSKKIRIFSPLLLPSIPNLPGTRLLRCSYDNVTLVISLCFLRENS